MIKKSILNVFVLLLNLSILSIVSCTLSSKDNISNKEDLWGNQVNLNEDKLTLIEPFSPANCGYCLFDGEFIKANYFKNNLENGGENFLQCLFNPQLDIYTYQKHYRSKTPVLTFPPKLHQFHRNGFPFLFALRDGYVISRGPSSPYEMTFNILKEKFWPDKNVIIELTSPIHMATRFINENNNLATTFIIPDNDSLYFKRSFQNANKYKNGIVKYESDINEKDLKRNIFYRGRFNDYIVNLLKDKEIPFEINEKYLYIGDYVFAQDSISVSICFPNPYNNEKYVFLRLSGDLTKGKNIMQNWVDFTISKVNRNNKLSVVMNGFFEKNNNKWTYSDSLTFINSNSNLKCTNGICNMPVKKTFEKDKIEFEKVKTEQTKYGKLTTLGKENCRFPEITTDEKDVVWCCWEENGNILLSSKDKSFIVEGDKSDSFNPVITYDGNNIWIFYLNNKSGFYRVYAKIFAGSRVSGEILISDNLVNDSINLGVASNCEGKVVISWTEWQANYKYPKYRIIDNRILGEIKDIAIKKPEIDYTNAWSTSLTFSRNGELWGAWNQHYPAILGVCSGDLITEAKSVTNLKPNEEQGGYPDCLNDSTGKRWVFWESFGWDVLNSKPQQIKAAFYDEKSEKWSLPYIISNDSETAFNQTPSASLDENGNINVVWSHRNLKSKFWEICFSTLKNNKWSEPISISEPNVNSRAPKIISNSKGKLIITWHSGIGQEMKIKLLELENTL
jgi:hypothetical protein